MSSRRATIALSASAREDLEHIVLRSLLTWGEEQARSYKAALDRALDDLAEFPELGRARDELRPGLRSRRSQQHDIFYYRTGEESMMVVRILHLSMNARDQFEQ